MSIGSYGVLTITSIINGMVDTVDLNVSNLKVSGSTLLMHIVSEITSGVIVLTLKVRLI